MMAHPFSTNQFYPGYATPYYPQQPQYHNPPPFQNAPAFQPPGMRQGAMLPPNFNGPHRFDQNQQLPLPNIFPPFPPVTHSSEPFRPFSSPGVVQPPPPPPPFLNLYAPPNTSMAPPTTIQSLPNMPPQSLSVHLPQESPLQPRDVPTPGNLVAEDNGPAYPGIQAQQSESPPAIGSSEEGELSDGEVPETDPIPTEAEPQDNVDDYISRHNTIKADKSTGNRHNQQGATKSYQVNGDDSPEDSVSSYTPPPVSPGPFRRDATNLDGLNEAQMFLEQMPAGPSGSATSKRGIAKDALKSLASYKITYRELQREDLDERILQELYSELDILDGLPANIDEPFPRPRSDTQTVFTQHTASVDPVDSRTQPALSQNLNQAPQPPAGPFETLREDSKTRASLSLERKDRIAQLLAAKTGRLPSRLSPNSPSPQIIEQTPKVGKASVRESPAPVLVLENARSALTNMKPAGPTASQYGLSTQQISTGSGLTVASLTSNDPPIEVATTGLQKVIQAAASAQLSRHRGGSPFAIPGLFMTSAELEQLDSPGPSGALDAMASQFSTAASAEAEGSLKRARSTESMNMEDLNEPDHKRPFTVAPADREEPSSIQSPDRDDTDEGEILEDEAQIKSTDIRLNGSLQTTSGLEARPQPLHAPVLAEIPRQPTPPNIGEPHPQISAQNYFSPPRNGDAFSSGQVMNGAERERQQRNLQSSPRSSTASTPVLPRPISQSQPETTAERVLQAPTVTVTSAALARPSSGPSTISPVPLSGSEALAARAAHLKAELMRQRMLRQQASQNAKPDEDAQRRQARLRLAEKQAELARMRADEERREEERREARKQQEALQEEMLRLEAELQDQTDARQAKVTQSQQTVAILPPSTDDAPTMLGEERSPKREVLMQSISHRGVGDQRDDVSAGDDSQDDDFARDDFEEQSPVSIPASGDSEPNDQRYEEAEDTEIIHADPNQVEEFEEVGEELSPMQSHSAASGSSGNTSAEIDGLYQQALHPHENASVDQDDHYSSGRSDSMDVDDQSEGSASMDDSGSETYEPHEEEADFQAEIEAESDGFDPQDQLMTQNGESVIEPEVFEPHDNIDEVPEQNEVDSDSYDPQDVNTGKNEEAPAQRNFPVFAATTMSLEPLNTAAIALNSIDSSRIATPDNLADSEYAPEASEPASLHDAIEQNSTRDGANLSQAS